MPKLLRQLGVRDAALIVMGGIIGSGIFMNPSVVARFVHSGVLVMGVWAAGGIVALLGAGIFAELAARRPRDGGLYAYLRDAFHPALAFVFGWCLLLVSQSGGMAAAAVTFANYFGQSAHLTLPLRAVAAAAIAVFTAINAMGVRTGASTQNAFMLLKIAAIAAFAAIGLFAVHGAAQVPEAMPASGALATIGLAMVPVLFAYSGWQTSSFMTAELRDPQATLPRGLLVGVVLVVLLYLAVNATCLRVLGIHALALTNTPASDVAQIAFGAAGRIAIAIVIAISTLGFLSNQILTSPRVYFQMAADGTFFKPLAAVNARTHAPVLAIVVQGAVAIVITLFLNYDQILNYVTSNDYIFFGFSAIALIVFRNRDAREANAPRPFFNMPGHPYTTVLFLAAAWFIVADTIWNSPRDTLIGIAILLSGLPVYWLFVLRQRRENLG